MIDLTHNWHQIEAELGLVFDPSTLPALIRAYAEPQRHYHNHQHLHECLALWQQTRDASQQAAEVALALWFHDAIYDPMAKDNEQRSADWTGRELANAGATAELADRVQGLILATCHTAAVAQGDAQWLVDIDLAILGADAERFDEYERQIRAEYRWVPGPLYRSKRREVLAAFHARPQLYATAELAERFETQARRNLAMALARLDA
jgi:predicted metal-dependent HD superfamily phosphohydrolase